MVRTVECGMRQRERGLASTRPGKPRTSVSKRVGRPLRSIGESLSVGQGKKANSVRQISVTEICAARKESRTPNCLPQFPKMQDPPKSPSGLCRAVVMVLSASGTMILRLGLGDRLDGAGESMGFDSCDSRACSGCYDPPCLRSTKPAHWMVITPCAVIAVTVGRLSPREDPGSSCADMGAERGIFRNIQHSQCSFVSVFCPGRCRKSANWTLKITSPPDDSLGTNGQNLFVLSRFGEPTLRSGGADWV